MQGRPQNQASIANYCNGELVDLESLSGRNVVQTHKTNMENSSTCGRAGCYSPRHWQDSSRTDINLLHLGQFCHTIPWRVRRKNTVKSEIIVKRLILVLKQARHIRVPKPHSRTIMNQSRSKATHQGYYLCSHRYSHCSANN